MITNLWATNISSFITNPANWYTTNETVTNWYMLNSYAEALKEIESLTTERDQLAAWCYEG